MKIHVRKWGNSIGIRIPKVFAKKIGINSGSEVEIDVSDNKIVVFKTQKKLDKLLDKITPHNIHGEINSGEPKGKEIW